MSNPVTYAENTLGVHSEYENAKVIVDELGNARGRVLESTRKLRNAESALEDAEADFMVDFRAANPEMSDTAINREVRIAMRRSDRLKDLRQQVRDAQNEVDLARSDVKQLEVRVSLATARLHELGGLLAFYAAATKR